MRNLSGGFCLLYLYCLLRFVISLPCSAHRKEPLSALYLRPCKAVLSLPEEDPGPVDDHHTLTRDQGLARLNSALLELPPHTLTSASITPAAVG